MGDKWDVHLSRQFGRTNGVWVYKTHTICPFVAVDLDDICKKSVRRDLWQQGT